MYNLVNIKYKLLTNTLQKLNMDSNISNNNDLDELVYTSNTYVLINTNEWYPVDYNIWRSWCGKRILLGYEFHGPVYIYNSPDNSLPWPGRRICTCNICQTHVQPSLKLN